LLVLVNLDINLDSTGTNVKAIEPIIGQVPPALQLYRFIQANIVLRTVSPSWPCLRQAKHNLACSFIAATQAVLLFFLISQGNAKNNAPEKRESDVVVNEFASGEGNHTEEEREGEGEIGGRAVPSISSPFHY
jgi:hypothetical protein